MGKTSVVFDMVDVQEHDSGERWNKFLFSLRDGVFLLQLQLLSHIRMLNYRLTTCFYKRSIMAGICSLFQVFFLGARIENLKYYPVFSSLFPIGKT